MTVTERQRDALMLASREYKETNDCSVYALAHATHGDYGKAHAALAVHGRMHRKGAYSPTIHRAVESMGYETHQVASFPKQGNGSQYTSKSLEKFMKTLPDGVYLVFTARHVYAHVYGENTDGCMADRSRIESVWRVTLKGRKK